MTGFGKMKKLLRGRSGMSYMLTVSLVLALLMLLCVMAEFARLGLIAYGVRDALQQSVISVATTNYNEVYDGLREGYSGGYRTDGSRWTANLDYGDVYGNLDRILGLGTQGGYHVKEGALGMNTGYPGFRCPYRTRLLRLEMPAETLRRRRR